MRRILLWAMSTLTVLVLLFGYHTSTSSRMAAAADSSAVAPVTGGAAAPITGGVAGASDAGSTGSTGSAAAGSGSGQTVTGSVAQTRWGPVQVQVTVADGRVTDVSVVQYPDGNGRDAQINARALPTLIDETISAQSADIDMVSGATITSEGYVQSLQSALDQAGL